MTHLAELEEFVGEHRPHGKLRCDATEAAWNGYRLTVRCLLASCSSGGMTRTMSSIWAINWCPIGVT